MGKDGGGVVGRVGGEERGNVGVRDGGMFGGGGLGW